jgi:hypothetical protein
VTCPCLAYGASDPVVNRLGLGAAALRYQHQGYAVLPLARGGKRPHRMLGDSGGVHWATRDKAMPPWAWGQDPAANVGVATGSPSRLAVIDMDVKNGAEGPAAFGRFLATYRLVMPTLPAWAATPSGGLHIWLRVPAGVTVPERPGILPGVDVKGDGGLVVAPPSMQLRPAMARPGERSGDPVPVPYEWSAGCPCQVPDAPGWLLPWLQSAPVPVTGVIGTGGTSGTGLDELVKTGVPRGSRNAVLYRLACARYRVHGTGPDSYGQVRAELEQVLAASDRGDFGGHELSTIMNSARRFVAAQETRETMMVQNYLRMVAR